MTQFAVHPTIQLCDTCQELANTYDLGPQDLLFTNDFLFDPYFAPLDLKCPVLFQEKYGLGEPTDEMVEAIYRDMPKDITRIVAVGGGTVLDVAKILSLKHVSPILDLYDGKLPVEKGKELILVPTTCGTGTEVTNISILALLSRRTKKGLANDAMYADQAVMIPELLGGLPFRFFATSSIDALIQKGYQAIQKDGPDARLPLLGDFLLASNFAGIAFGNAGCAAVHALAYPLGAVYHVPHGESNYAVFTGVMNQYMRLKTDGAIAELNQFMANILGCEVANLYTALEDLLGCLIPKKSLREYGMTEAEIEAFADSVVENQQRLLANNFVPLKRDQIRDIYRAIY